MKTTRPVFLSQENPMPVHTLIFSAVLTLATSSLAFATEGEGLTAAPRWQGRILLGTASSNSLLGNAGSSAEKLLSAQSGSAVRGVSVMGDYYFGNRPVARSAASALADQIGGGFRATSGLLVGPRGASYASLGAAGFAASSRNFSVDLRSASLPLADQAASEANAVPYLGVGYTGVSVKGGWGFSADVGVMALNPSSAVKLGRVLGGGQSLDDALREMRVSPVLQLGVSYSF
jgi:hypothetical protein